MKTLDRAIAVEDRWNSWLAGLSPFLFLCGRVFTLIAIHNSYRVRVFEHMDNGEIYHLNDYTMIKDGSFDIDSFVLDAGFDSQNPTLQQLITHLVTKRIEAAE